MSTPMNDFYKSLPKSISPARDQAFLDEVRAGRFDCYEFVAITSGPVTFYAMTRSLKIHGTRCTVGHRTAQLIVDSLYMILPTTKMSDLIWARCPVGNRLAPKTRDWNYNHPITGMDTARMVEQSAYVDTLEAGKVGLCADEGKDWALDDRNAVKRIVGGRDMGYSGNNYGWRKLDGVKWQPLSDFHDDEYTDYSQYLRGVFRWCFVDGVGRDILDVLRDPNLAHHVAAVPKGKKMTCIRHPAAEILTPIHAYPTPDFVSTPVIDMTPTPSIPFVQAKNYYPGRRHRVTGKPCGVDLVVIHDMEHPERPNAAEAVAAWAAGKTAPRASWHYAVDCDSIVQSVKEEDTAWHAPGANHNSIGIEHAGYARQTAEEWMDGYSQQMLERSAKLVADICARHSIPLVVLDAEALLKGERGIVTHAEISKACALATKRKLTTSVFFNQANPRDPLGDGHADPGKHFPMEWFMAQVKGPVR